MSELSQLEKAKEPSHGSKRIVVADDDAELHRSLVAYLEADTWSVVSVANAFELASVLVGDEQPHVLLVELWLGDANSLEVIARHPAPHRRPLPIVLMGTNLRSEDIAAATRLGVARMLWKPLDFGKLRGALSFVTEGVSNGLDVVTGLTVLDLLQAFHVAQRTLGLAVPGRPAGNVTIVRGEVVDAQCGKLVGEPALDMLLQRSAKSVLPFDVPRAMHASIASVPFDELVAAALARISDARPLRRLTRRDSAAMMAAVDSQRHTQGTRPKSSGISELPFAVSASPPASEPPPVMDHPTPVPTRLPAAMPEPQSVLSSSLGVSSEARPSSRPPPVSGPPPASSNPRALFSSPTGPPSEARPTWPPPPSSGTPSSGSSSSPPPFSSPTSPPRKSYQPSEWEEAAVLGEDEEAPLASAAELALLSQRGTLVDALHFGRVSQLRLSMQWLTSRAALTMDIRALLGRVVSLVVIDEERPVDQWLAVIRQDSRDVEIGVSVLGQRPWVCAATLSGRLRRARFFSTTARLATSAADFVEPGFSRLRQLTLADLELGVVDGALGELCHTLVSDVPAVEACMLVQQHLTAEKPRRGIFGAQLDEVVADQRWRTTERVLRALSGADDVEMFVGTTGVGQQTMMGVALDGQWLLLCLSGASRTLGALRNKVRARLPWLRDALNNKILQGNQTK